MLDCRRRRALRTMQQTAIDVTASPSAQQSQMRYQAASRGIYTFRTGSPQGEMAESTIRAGFPKEELGMYSRR